MATRKSTALTQPSSSRMATRRPQQQMGAFQRGNALSKVRSLLDDLSRWRTDEREAVRSYIQKLNNSRAHLRYFLTNPNVRDALGPQIRQVVSALETERGRARAYIESINLGSGSGSGGW